MRIRAEIRPLIGTLGAAVLLASLFLDWYPPGLTAWRVFEVLDLVLAALALGAVWLALSPLLLDEPAREGGSLAVGVASLVIVASQLINHPPAAGAGSPRAGAWVALAGAALMAGSALPAPRRLAWRDRPARGLAPSDEAAEVEPGIYGELYPEHHREGPIGADDPDLFQAATELEEGR